MDLNTQYDTVIHIVEESGLPLDKQIAGVAELFPAFISTGDENDQFMTDYILEKYAYARSVGLSIEDAAHSAEISTILMNKVLLGSGLSIEKFVKLIKAELYAKSLMKRKHIANIDEASEGKNYQASIAFLEKMYPESYGPKSTIALEPNGQQKKWEIEVTHVNQRT